MKLLIIGLLLVVLTMAWLRQAGRGSGVLLIYLSVVGFGWAIFDRWEKGWAGIIVASLLFVLYPLVSRLARERWFQ